MKDQDAPIHSQLLLADHDPWHLLAQVRALVRMTGPLWPPIHPAWLCSSSVVCRRVCALLAPRQAGASTPIVDPVILTRAPRRAR
jgi:hypothetical protein